MVITFNIKADFYPKLISIKIKENNVSFIFIPVIFQVAEQRQLEIG